MADPREVLRYIRHAHGLPPMHVISAIKTTRFSLYIQPTRAAARPNPALRSQCLPTNIASCAGVRRAAPSVIAGQGKAAAVPDFIIEWPKKP